MSNNDAYNEQWLTAGSKKNNKGGKGDIKNKAGHNGIYSNEGEQGFHTQSLKPGGEKVPSGNINKAGKASGWTKVNGKHHVQCDNLKTAEDGMKQYSVNVRHIDVRFMCGN
jgi:hypothetical protein